MKEMTYKEAILLAQKELLENSDIIFFGQDIKEYGGVFQTEENLYHDFDIKMFNTPLSEASITGVAVGSALTGLRPIVKFDSSELSLLALDQIVNQAAQISFLSKGKLKAPVTLRIPNDNLTGLGSIQSQNFESLFYGIPGIKVIAPSSPNQAYQMLKKSVFDNSPVVFFENKYLYNSYGPVENDEEFQISQSVIELEGEDVTVVAWGVALLKVLSIIEVLKREGISIEVINPLTLYPMDKDTIYKSVEKTSRLVIVHDGPKTGGIGSDIAASVVESYAFDYLDAPIIRVCAKDSPLPYNTSLRSELLISKKEILDAIYSVMGIN